jgi:hypothetical protein
MPIYKFRVTRTVEFVGYVEGDDSAELLHTSPVLIQQAIEFTDFPLRTIDLIVRDQTLLLPSEGFEDAVRFYYERRKLVHDDAARAAQDTVSVFSPEISEQQVRSWIAETTNGKSDAKDGNPSGM